MKPFYLRTFACDHAPKLYEKVESFFQKGGIPFAQVQFNIFAAYKFTYDWVGRLYKLAKG
ncbi:hypothetical protein D3C73_1602400 [compost metagenome]